MRSGYLEDRNLRTVGVLNMPVPTLLLPPDQSSYAAQLGAQAIAVQLDGGASRVRQDQLGQSHRLTVQWTCNFKNYNYLMAFFRTSTSYGALPFIMALLLDAATVQNYTCLLVPGSLSLSSVSGFTFVVSATIEVLFDPTYAAGDAALIAGGIDA